jgi:hypothetical protein
MVATINMALLTELLAAPSLPRRSLKDASEVRGSPALLRPAVFELRPQPPKAPLKRAHSKR